MYNVNDIIVYGSVGVFKITSISQMDNDLGNESEKKSYYVLSSLFNNETVYVPIDNPNIFIRSVISKENAEKLIDNIPNISVQAYHSRNLQQLSEHYKNAFKSHNCEDLIELVMSIHLKKQNAKQNKKRIGQIDEKFMKKAENLLYEELSVSLGIPKDQVSEYISSRVNIN